MKGRLSLRRDIMVEAPQSKWKRINPSGKKFKRRWQASPKLDRNFG